MQHLMAGDKSLLVGDEVARLLLEYAAQIARTGGADSVYVQAIGSDGDAVEAGLLLDAGTVLVTETSRSSLPEPDNQQTEAHLRDRLAAFDLDGFTPFGLDPDES